MQVKDRRKAFAHYTAQGVPAALPSAPSRSRGCTPLPLCSGSCRRTCIAILTYKQATAPPFERMRLLLRALLAGPLMPAPRLQHLQQHLLYTGQVRNASGHLSLQRHSLCWAVPALSGDTAGALNGLAAPKGPAASVPAWRGEAARPAPFLTNCTPVRPAGARHRAGRVPGEAVTRDPSPNSSATAAASRATACRPPPCTGGRLRSVPLPPACPRQHLRGSNLSSNTARQA